jgi:GNAT superfamily N-acetyltransferase
VTGVVTDVRLRALPEADLQQWRESRAGGVPLPDLAADDEAVSVVADGVPVGGAILTYPAAGDRVRCVVRVLQTTLTRDDTDRWTGVARALESHARDRGADLVSTAVAPGVTGAFGAAGYRATMIGVFASLDQARALVPQQDRRVSVRPMDHAERVRYAEDTRVLMQAGMQRAGVVDASEGRIEELEARLGRLVGPSLPADELLLTAEVDGSAVGSAWATVQRDTTGLHYLGHALHLYPERRGTGLSLSFVAALLRHAEALAITDIRMRVYGFDEWARSAFILDSGLVSEVHVRKDLPRRP